MSQSSRGLKALSPSLLCVVLLVIPVGLPAQGAYRAVVDENFRRSPGQDGTLLARVQQNTVLSGAGEIQGNWIELDLEGWIWAPSTGRTNRDGFSLIVTAAGGENLRTSPRGEIVARLQNGALLHELERGDGWVRVRRTGWMYSRSLEEVESPPQTVAATGDAATLPAPIERTNVLDRGLLSRDVALAQTRDTAGAGTVPAGTALSVLARDGDMVRVRFEGWVPADAIETSEDLVMQGVTAGEVRSRPGEFAGRLLQWRVKFISLQTADELRRDIAAGSKYILARGPLPEAAFVYLVVPAEAVAAMETMEPLTDLVIVGRLRGRQSDELGNPIMDLVDYRRVDDGG